MDPFFLSLFLLLSFELWQSTICFLQPKRWTSKRWVSIEINGSCLIIGAWNIVTYPLTSNMPFIIIIIFIELSHYSHFYASFIFSNSLLQKISFFLSSVFFFQELK